MRTIKYIIIILGITGVFLDNRLFYYGQSKLNIFSALPFNLKPISRPAFEGGFVLEDQYGFFLVSKGENRYVGLDTVIAVDSIIGYGYGDGIVVVEVADNNNGRTYLQFRKNEKKKETLEVKIIKDYDLAMKKLNWFNISQNRQLKINIKVRNYCFLLTIFFTMILLGKVAYHYFYRKNSAGSYH